MGSPANLNDVIQRIRKAGPTNVRVVPMEGQHINEGLHRIEVLESGKWSALVESLPRSTAQDLVSQATNRVILG